MKNGAVDVSVVIASHRPAYIGELVDRLLHAQEIPPTEIVVVADYAISEAQQHYPQVVWLFRDARSIPLKRNAGVTAARGEIIAFIDDDCLPGPDWIRQGCAYLRDHPSIAGVEGKTVIENQTGEPYAAQYKRLERRGYRTNNIFYRKSLFLQAGGFDERFPFQREDLDLAFTILDMGYDIAYEQSVRVMHRLRPRERWDLLKNCINRRFDPLLYRKFPSRYRAVIGSPFPGTLLCIGGLQGGALVAGLLFPRALVVLLLPALLVAGGAGLSRCRGIRLWIRHFLSEWLSFFCAPAVLLGALVLGSIRSRKWLLI